MKKKKSIKPLLIPEKEIQDLQVDYITELESNIKYSLEVDPENNYNFTEKQKEFIQQYIQFKSVASAAMLCKIDNEIAQEWFSQYNTQKEIRRINMALYQRQFASKLLSLDQIGGYLTSMLTDNFIPLADRISSTDKLKVVDMLIKINNLKNEAIQNPGEIIHKDIDNEIKILSVDAIKRLLESNDNNKEDLINQINKENVLSPEEKSYLETLSSVELLKLLNELNKK